MANELYHHGIKGQKWGVRRFQNADGSLKPAGKKRYGSDSSTETKSSNDKLKKAAVTAAVSVGAAAAGYALGYKLAEAHPFNKDAVKLALNTAMANLEIQAGGSLAAIKASPYTAAGKKSVDKIMQTPVGQGMKSGVKKVIKTSAEGATIIASKKVLDKVIGESNADTLIKSYNSFNKKNKVNLDALKGNKVNKEDEDDDD